MLIKRLPFIRHSIAGMLLALAVLSATPHPSRAVQNRGSAPIHAQRLTVQVLEKRPHDPTAFTEGFELDHGVLYESSGLYGQSNLRSENPENGQPTRRHFLPEAVFGEGIAIDGNQMVQLTWREHVAYVYNLADFSLIKTFSYDGEGWGMCFDGQDYIMSNGSAALAVRDPKTFGVVRAISVDLDGTPIDQLNEVECVGDSIYANVWMTDEILQIDKATGHVTALIDATGLITPQERHTAGPDGVLNGIAYDPQTKNFLITGKLWPWMFVVRFVPAMLNYF
jgi:glutaminyl-peptide cyclotransferase